MRPKKLILDVDPKAGRQGMRSLVLTTRGYRVIQASTAEEARALLEKLQHVRSEAANTVDLLLVELSLDRSQELLCEAARMHPSLPLLLVSAEIANHDLALQLGAFLPENGRSNAELLERIECMVARKRGPKRAMAASENLEKLRA